MIEVPPFSLDLRAHRTKEKRRAYVVAELARLRDEGQLSLLAILGCGVDGADSLALEILADGDSDAEGQSLVDGGVYAPVLKLVDKARPPESDPQGRRLPDAKRGKVLVVKVGQKQLPTGTERDLLAKRGRDIYDTVEIGPKPRPYLLRHAAIAMRQLGKGLASELARGIVEEVLPTVEAAG